MIEDARIIRHYLRLAVTGLRKRRERIYRKAQKETDIGKLKKLLFELHSIQLSESRMCTYEVEAAYLWQAQVGLACITIEKIRSLMDFYDIPHQPYTGPTKSKRPEVT